MVTGRRFFKMSGSGNDFVVVDARREPVGELERPEVVRRICARGTGIGADGVVFIEPADDGGADFRMRYLNSDGSRADMCGNAALCVTRLAAELGAGAAAGMRIQSDVGVLQARVGEAGPEVELRPVTEVRPDAGVDLAPGEQRIGFALAGVPHLVVLCDSADAVDVIGRGRPLRRHSSLPRGANVNFVSAAGEGRWRMRTYERGVEGETLACGTGAIATAVLLQAWGLSGTESTVATSSGRLATVRLARDGATWRPTLCAEGRIVYRGEIVET